MRCGKSLEDWISRIYCGASGPFKVHLRRTPKWMARTLLFSAQTTILDWQTIPSSSKRLSLQLESTERGADRYELSQEHWIFTLNWKRNWQITGELNLRSRSSQDTPQTSEQSCALATNVTCSPPMN